MIPNWTERGILPPINYLNPTSNQRSPYLVTISDVVLKYGNSLKRKEILLGLLKLRNDLYEIGINKGFHWINGSFLENIELIENRPPNDVDIVTFYYLPEGLTQKDLILKNSKVFDPIILKKNYKVDGYFVAISQLTPEKLINRSTYWYSMWSHKRDETWKGFLQIDLSQNEDKLAWENLNNMSTANED